jgi:hypothetical protein
MREKEGVTCMKLRPTFDSTGWVNPQITSAKITVKPSTCEYQAFMGGKDCKLLSFKNDNWYNQTRNFENTKKIL